MRRPGWMPWMLAAAVSACSGSEQAGYQKEIDAEPEDEASALFDPDVVRTYDIQLSEENLAFLDADPAREEYVEGALLFEGRRIGPVGVRYKGGNGSWALCLSGFTDNPTIEGSTFGGQKMCHKLSMKIKFDWKSPDDRFYGLRKLQLHAMIADHSELRERLGYAIYREMGLVAPRTAPARVLINGKLQGLYTLVEQIDGRYTRSRFREGGEGNLYKEVWPMGDDPGRYLDALHTNEDEHPSASRMIRLSSEIGAAPDVAAGAEVLRRWFDVGYLMRVIALEWVLGADDGIYNWVCQRCADANARDCLPPSELNLGDCTNHNFYVYEEVAADRLWILPWDMDQLFRGGEFDYFFDPLVTAWDEQLPCEVDDTFQYFGRMPPNCNPLLAAATRFQKEYVEAVEELLDGPFSEAAVNAKLDAWTAQIRPYVKEQSDTFGDDAKPTLIGWEATVKTLRDKITALRDAARKDLVLRKHRLGSD